MRIRRFAFVIFVLVAVALVACGDSAGAPVAGYVASDAAAPTDAATGDASQGDAGVDASADAGFVPAPHMSFPQVTQVAGGVLAPMRLVSVVAGGDPMAAQIFSFGDAAMQSQWYLAMGADYGVGAPGPSIHVTGPAIASGTALDDVMIDNYIRQAIQAANPSPMPDGKTLYAFYAPPGVTVPGQTPPCTFPRGYHRGFGSGDGAAIIGRCAPQDIELLTIVASHEIAEAASDTGRGWALRVAQGAMPWTTSPWAECEGIGHCEVGDLCTVGARVVEGAFTYQRIFSNTAAARGGDPCVPALPIPYYNVSAAQGWYAGTSNGSVSIPIVGWSTAPTDDWLVTTGAITSAANLAVATVLQGLPTVTVAGATHKVINNGHAATLEVTLPDTSSVGGPFWTVVLIKSFRLDLNGNTPVGEDRWHRWEIGVYVP